MDLKSNNLYTLNYYCPDKMGIFADLYQYFFEKGAFVVESAHFTAPDTNVCYYRKVFDTTNLVLSFEEFKLGFATLAEKYEMTWEMTAVNHKPKLLVAVSKYDHCLNLLLGKHKSGALHAEIAAVYSNHNDCRDLVEWHGIPYYHLPISKATKLQQENAVRGLIKKYDIDLLVLARYMQVLTDEFCAELEGKAINIHHSFLPSFKGAKPYHQAYDRGVKLIGATAHYVNGDLDEGPIIVQNVKPVTHCHTPEDMVMLSHDNEASTLAQAIKLHVEKRVILNGNKTIIF